MLEFTKHLTKFEKTSDYEDFLNSDEFVTPNVSLTKDDNVVHYHILVDYSKEYFTIENTGSEALTFRLMKNTTAQTVSYMGSDSSDWVDTSDVITVAPQSELKLKGAIAPVSSYGIGTFKVSGNTTYNVKGNVMSLLYGDEFEGQTDLTGKDYSFYGLFKDNAKLVDSLNLTLPATKLATYCYAYMFNGCTSLASAPALPATTLASRCYSNMFNGCISLVSAPELPAITLANYCYQSMFNGCISLVSAPELPAITLAKYCYQYMFQGCTSLVLEPELPATTLASTCYDSMFQGCTSLVSAPELPATTLASICYQGMFRDCTSLASAPELPATTLTSGCYSSMFQGCTSLESAPELPATTLANGCYEYMFQGCTSLASAPALPATILAIKCYSNMFKGCTSLVSAPELPATTLANYCYQYMFQRCISLASAPELPATTLADYCYQYMFQRCISLASAPELPATTLAKYCYYYMFQDCSKLNNITMLATNISASNCLTYWVSGVASSGTFIKNPLMTSLPNGSSGIPNGWTVMNQSPCIINTTSASTTFNSDGNGLFTPNNEAIDLSKHLTRDELLSIQPTCDISINLVDKNNVSLVSDYMWVYSKTLNDILIELDITADVYELNVIITNVCEPEDNGYYYYTTDNETSATATTSDYFSIVNEGGNSLTIYRTVSACDSYTSKPLYYKTENGAYWTTFNSSISIAPKEKVMFKGSSTSSGSTETELIGTLSMQGDTYCSVVGNIMSLLYGDDFIGKKTLTQNGNEFLNLFSGCYQLKYAHNLFLPATTLADYCYSNMFYGCTSLVSAPALPATTLADYCYQYMFQGCTSLASAPALPATTLANGCYQYMFQGCTSLASAPELPATTLAMYCYYYMFQGCTSLASAPALPATTLANGCYLCMFQACTSLESAPELPATTLAKYCYQYMFQGCSKLNKVTMLATNISATSSLSYWVSGVATSGTFIKNPLMTSLPNGSSGIPNGWTVEDYKG